MTTYDIALIPGDGVGGEVVAAGREVLDTVARTSPDDIGFDWTEYDWGSDYFAQHTQMMPEDGLDRLRAHDAIYFGAVGSANVPDHVSLWGLRLRICQGLDQWANVRPVRFLPNVPTPLRTTLPELDWVVIRENSEGEYAGLGGRNLSARGEGNEVAVQTSLFTEKGCERIMRYAFEVARSRPRRRLTSVTKSNAQQYGMVLWDEVFARVRKDYPDVETDSCLVDAMAARFVLHPSSLDVVVASNLNADILSDLGSALAGSLGLAASANLNPERRTPSMFEPVHGSAPDIAGLGIANPIGAIESGALMLEHFGLNDDAARLRRAVDATARSGVLTPDLGGTAPRSAKQSGLSRRATAYRDHVRAGRDQVANAGAVRWPRDDRSDIASSSSPSERHSSSSRSGWRLLNQAGGGSSPASSRSAGGTPWSSSWSSGS
jgi:tartrate dehydrogenase/decarboxylase / D-malate dehydrogenase